MATFKELLQQVDDNINVQRNRGTVFEKMVVSYF